MQEKIRTIISVQMTLTYHNPQLSQGWSMKVELSTFELLLKFNVNFYDVPSKNSKVLCVKLNLNVPLLMPNVDPEDVLMPYRQRSRLFK